MSAGRRLWPSSSRTMCGAPACRTSTFIRSDLRSKREGKRFMSNNKKIQRLIPAMVLTALAAGAVHPAGALAASTTTQKFKGPVIDSQYGPFQAIIYGSKKKITKGKIGTQPE